MTESITITVETGDQLRALRFGLDHQLEGLCGQIEALHEWHDAVVANYTLPVAGCQDLALHEDYYDDATTKKTSEYVPDRLRQVAEHVQAHPEDDMELGDDQLRDRVAEWLQERARAVEVECANVARLVQHIDEACNSGQRSWAECGPSGERAASAPTRKHSPRRPAF